MSLLPLGLWQVAIVPSVIFAAKRFRCTRVIAYSLAKLFVQTGISINEEDILNVGTQCKDKTVNLNSHIGVAALAGKCRCYTPQHFISEIKEN